MALHTGGDARAVVSVDFHGEVSVLKEFRERNSWVTYVAGIDSLKEAGIPNTNILLNIEENAFKVVDVE